MKPLIFVTNPNQATVLSASSGDEISGVRQQKKDWMPERKPGQPVLISVPLHPGREETGEWVQCRSEVITS